MGATKYRIEVVVAVCFLIGCVIRTVVDSNKYLISTASSELEGCIDQQERSGVHNVSMNISSIATETSPVPTTLLSHHVASTVKGKKRIRTNVDFFNCPVSSNHLALTAKSDPAMGLGHQMFQAMAVFRRAIIDGHCYCWNRDQQNVLYKAFLKPLFPLCAENLTKIPVDVSQSKDIEKKLQNIRTDEEINHKESLVEVYDMFAWSHKFADRGYGDVYGFVDHFFESNHVVEEIIYPYYLANVANTSQSPFQETNNEETDVVNAALHVRVGDMKLEATESYWYNLIGEVRRVVDSEYHAGKSLPIQIHFVYNAKRDQRTDEELQAQFGQWPSLNSTLPKSHNFLGRVCQQYEDRNVRCYWKEGCSMSESIDLMLRADLIYISGSSFSQTLSMFNPYAIKLYAVPKELNWHGAAQHIPFLSTHASALSSTEYYYIHVDGHMYAEQQAYMNLEKRSSRRRRRLTAVSHQTKKSVQIPER